jgi:hypothetical protein
MLLLKGQEVGDRDRRRAVGCACGLFRGLKVEEEEREEGEFFRAEKTDGKKLRKFTRKKK